MSEQLDLAVVIVPPTVASYKIRVVVLDWAGASIRIDLMGSDGTSITAEYREAQAIALMTNLNSMNFSTISLHKRILQKLVSDGKLPAGIVSGTAQ